jgi:uncharacterized membrane protein
MTRWRLLTHLRASLWFVPVLCVLAGATLSFGTIALDRLFDYDALPNSLVGDPAAANAVLSTVAAAMVSLATLVLTITIVVVQLAMGQFSPRIVQRILRDKPSQLAIGLFVATFVHAILTLREVHDNGDGTGRVPGIAVLTTFVLVLASIAVLVIYVQHLGQALRVSALVELVGHDTRGLIDKLYPDKGAPAPAAERPVVRARESGVVTAVGYEELVEEAARADCMLELVPAIGEFVPADAPLLVVHGDRNGLDEDRLHRAIVLKLERTLDRDVGYGLRLLVDILRQLARRPFPDGLHRDETGELRLVVRVPSWQDYVELATEELTLVGADSPRVVRRLRLALEDLREIAPPERREIVERRLELLDAAATEDSGHESRRPAKLSGLLD